MSDYLYWRQELKNPGCNARDTNRTDLSGFYRIAAAATKPEWPLAIWKQNDGLVAKIGEKVIRSSDVETWYDFLGSTWMKAHAVTEAAYRSALKDGHWPADPKTGEIREAKHRDAQPRSDANADIKMVHTDIRTGAVPGPGHNLPADPFEALKLELEGELELGRELYKTPIETAEQADKVAVTAKKIAAIRNRADKMREKEKAPHLEAGRAVDEKFREPIASADKAAAALKKHSEPWFDKLARDELARQKAARAEADRLAKEAAHAAAEAMAAAASPGIDTKDADEVAARAKEAQEKARIAETDTRARNPSTGRTGAKLSQRPVVSAKITDWTKAIDTFKAAPKLRDVVQELADRSVANGIILPGFERHEGTKVV